MYTKDVRRKRTDTQEPTDLGRLMKRWRQSEGLTVEAAGERIGVVKSTWGKIERGANKASMETLAALSALLGRTVDELAAKDGREIHRSVSNAERAQRTAELAEKMPPLGVLLDLLPELTGAEVDTLLSVGESLVRQRKDRK